MSASDPNVEAVRALLLQRSERGMAKYGVTTADAGLGLEQWLVHLREELLDGAIYCTAALAQMKSGERG